MISYFKNQHAFILLKINKLIINIMDSKAKTGSPDRDRINIHEDYELEDWSKKFGVSKEELKKAVAAAGTSAKAVADYLKK
jgi:hypothetical protein